MYFPQKKIHYMVTSHRSPETNAYIKINVQVSQPKHMLWALKKNHIIYHSMCKSDGCENIYTFTLEMLILSYMCSNMYVWVKGHVAVLYDQNVYNSFLNHLALLKGVSHVKCTTHKTFAIFAQVLFFVHFQ